MSGNSPALPVPNDQGTRAAQVAQGGKRRFGAAFLYHGNADRKAREPEQHQGFGAVAEREIDRARNDQQQQHWLLQYIHHGAPPRTAGGMGQFVGALGREPFGGDGSRQTGSQTCARTHVQAKGRVRGSGRGSGRGILYHLLQ